MESRPLPEDESLPRAPEADQTPHDDAHDGEFRLTVRKLELPVRPRGVLAD